MEFTGRMLTQEEADRVQHPFAKNSGERWSLRTIKRYVDIGAEMLDKDEDQKKEIVEGVKLSGVQFR